MPLLAEYAITPDVFDVASYTSEEVCGLCLDMIREPMLTEGFGPGSSGRRVARIVRE